MHPSNDATPSCLVCKQDAQTVPLIALAYRDANLWICPQHLPILIHHPQRLAGILPGAEHLPEAEHHDH